MNDLAKARVDALTIAINLMERHLAAATPGGAGRDSNAYLVAVGRIETLKFLRETLEAEV